VETYRLLTRQVIDRFLDHRLSFPDCIAALDAALADFMSRFNPEQLDSIRALMLANNDIRDEGNGKARATRSIAELAPVEAWRFRVVRAWKKDREPESAGGGGRRMSLRPVGQGRTPSPH